MKQLLLRVPDELHARLKRRAEREGRSVNAMATQILSDAPDPHADAEERRARLRAKIAELGWAPPERPSPGPPMTAEEREAAIASTRGLGPGVADREIEYERNRLGA